MGGLAFMTTVIDASPGRLVDLPEGDGRRTLDGIEQLDGNGDEGEPQEALPVGAGHGEPLIRSTRGRTICSGIGRGPLQAVGRVVCPLSRNLSLGAQDGLAELVLPRTKTIH